MNFFQEFRAETKILLVVALAAVVLAFGGILLLQTGLGPSSPTSSTPTSQPISNQQSEVDTSTWQTYRSDEFYGFEFAYPPSLEVTTDSYGWQEELENGERIGFSCFSLELTPRPQATAEQNFGVYINCPGRGLEGRIPEEYFVDGHKANRYTFEYENFDYKDVVVVFFKDDRIYNFTTDKIKSQQDEELFNKILSTVRFLEKSSSIREIDLASHLSSLPPYSECDEFAPSMPAVFVDNIEYFDVTNDGKEEAVVIASSCYTGTAGPDIVGVYTLDSAGDVRALQFKEGLQSHLIRWNPNKQVLIGFTGVYEASDANCCPSREKIVEYAWDSSLQQFIILSEEIRERVHRNKAFWNDDCYIDETAC